MSDLLLEWMSFRCDGRLADLPLDLIHGPPRRMLDDLSMLGHVEVPTSSSWRIAAPVLAGTPTENNPEPAAVLCGARTPGVIARVERAATAAGAWLHVTAIPNRPSQIRVVARNMADLKEVAVRASMSIQMDAAYTLLACLPTIRNWPRQPCQMVAGRVETVRRFSGSNKKWIDSSLPEATAAQKGFFRIKRDWDWVSILKTSQSDCAYIDDRAGRLFTASKLRFASWETGRFGMPIELFPPATIARALVLCTGLLPQFDSKNRRLSFEGVSPAMLRLVLAITGLRLS